MDVPENLDWVTALSKCSLLAVFQNLAEVLDHDVAKANTMGRSGCRFELTRPAPDRISVLRRRDLGGMEEIDAVVFLLAMESIQVVRRDMGGKGPDLFSAKPTFRPAGECFLEVNGEDLRLWQVSRKALQDLFFGS